MASTTDSAPKDAKKLCLVELKPTKVLFKQKNVDWATGMAYMKGLVALNEFLESHKSALSSIPDEHLSVIAKLVHESDKSLNVLCKQLKKTLCPPSAESDSTASPLEASLTTELLEKTVNRVAERRNYGLEDAPAAFSIWRWEVGDLTMVQDSVANKDLPLQRQEQRVQAKAELRSLFDALSPAEREALVKKKEKSEPKPKAGKEKEKEKDKDSMDIAEGSVSPSKSTTDPKPKASTSGTTKPPKKDKIATSKSAALMASFFGKASTSKAAAPKPEASSSTEQFDRHFRSFTVRKNTTLAPINRFTASASAPKSVEVIVLDEDGDVRMIEETTPANAQQTPESPRRRLPPLRSDPQNFLQEFISKVPSSRRIRPSTYTDPTDHNSQSIFASPQKGSTSSPSKSNTSSLLKSRAPVSVRILMTHLVEAEVTGDETRTRRILSLLQNRTLIPAKLLQFADDVRPPYFGTWTKSSSVVGPRTPLKRDLVAFDYSYDSGDEWEDWEKEGDVEGAEDVGSDDEEEGDEGSDDEDDGFLVDDDEIDMLEDERVSTRSSRSASPVVARPSGNAKRKADAAASGASSKKRRQLVGPLVAFVKGPFYENPIGQCEYEQFAGFRIRLLNDSPYGLDPFTFVSGAEDEYRAYNTLQAQLKSQEQHAASSSSSTIPTTNPSVPSTTLPSRTTFFRPVADIFAMPTIPGDASPSNSASTLVASTSALSASSTSAAPGKKAGPVFNLPPALYPDFLRAIDGSDKPKAVLVDELYKAFKDAGGSTGGALRKGAVDSKLAEIGFKEKKVWRVRPEAWSAAGLAPPARS